MKFKTAKSGGSTGDPTFSFKIDAKALNDIDVTVTPSDNTVLYMWDNMSKAAYDELGGGDNAVKQYLLALFKMYKEQLGYDAAKVVSILGATGVNSYNYTKFAASSDFYFWAIGVDSNSNPTTKASLSPMFTTPGSGEEPSDAYKAWLGTWTLKSTSSSESKEPMSMDITIETKAVNSTYAVKGWDISILRNELPVVAKFKDNGLAFENTQVLRTENDGRILKYRAFCTVNMANGQEAFSYAIGTYDAMTRKLGADKTTATVTGYSGKLITDEPFRVETMVQLICNATTGSVESIYKPGEVAGFKDHDFPTGTLTLTKKSSSSAPASSKVSTGNTKAISVKTSYTNAMANSPQVQMQMPSMLKMNKSLEMQHTGNFGKYDLKKIRYSFDTTDISVKNSSTKIYRNR